MDCTSVQQHSTACAERPKHTGSCKVTHSSCSQPPVCLRRHPKNPMDVSHGGRLLWGYRPSLCRQAPSGNNSAKEQAAAAAAAASTTVTGCGAYCATASKPGYHSPFLCNSSLGGCHKKLHLTQGQDPTVTCCCCCCSLTSLTSQTVTQTAEQPATAGTAAPTAATVLPACC
jgi:hypothetical protein